MKARPQKGQIFPHGKIWYLRYRVPELQPDGSFKNTQKCQSLAPIGGKYRSEAAVRELADEFLAPYNNNRTSLLSAATLNHWMEKHYLPMVKQTLKRRTYRDYFNKWNRYVKPDGEIPLRDFRTTDGQAMLRRIAEREDLTKTTLKHVRNLVSGAFTFAIQQGVLTMPNNPMRYVKMPKGRRSEVTYAYSVEEIMTMLNALPEPAATAVAVAAFAGPRDTEIRGLRWEDYYGSELLFSRSVDRAEVEDMKTPASKAHVPVIQPLAERLDAYRHSLGSPTSGFMFATGKGTPLNLQALAQRVIRPALCASGVEWHGWHACRRGLATTLHRLGVADKVIQAILRHASVAVTQGCYIKTSSSDVVEAMKVLERATVVQQLRQATATKQ